jgi:phenylacetic acid degradation operon negative regulatory protein
MSGLRAIQLEPIRPQELAITLFGAYVRPEPRPIWSGGIVQLLKEFGFSTSAARATLSRLVDRGYLRRIRNGRLVSYEITKHCEEVLIEGEQRIFSLGSNTAWDGSWTVVWHSIPKRSRRKRGRFGIRLRFLGFGSIQDGTWISPHDREREVLAVVEELGVSAHVGVLIGRPAADLQIDRVIDRSWDLEALSRRYQRFVDEFESYCGKPDANLTDRDAFLARTSLAHAFRQFPFLDPDLPDELMPGSDARRNAVRVFHDVYQRLGDPAQRHFEQVAVQPASRQS